MLRVSCEVMNGSATKRRLITTDDDLQADVMKTLSSFGLSEATREKLIDLLKSRQGRYGYVHASDDATGAYASISVLPDPVIAMQVFVGNDEMNALFLQSNLQTGADAFLAASNIPADFREKIAVLLSETERFDEPVGLYRSDGRHSVSVQMGYVNSSSFVQQPTVQQKKWRGPGF